MKQGKLILLHTCCGPCATASVERLLEDGWSVELFYSNSNIAPEDEYDKRLKGVIKTADYFGIEWSADEYDHEAWLQAVRGLENEPERGERCAVCFGYSFGRAAEKAAGGDYDGFTTTLSISPYKDSKLLYRKGAEAGGFIEYNFKKQNGYKRSIELSAAIGLYRQNYCGCEFSYAEMLERQRNKKHESEVNQGAGEDE
ncbi:MAG: epoxyqueuosine reductase QueH [Spirochaetales bacterium]|uniref:Epoxyqueuosine reductase QueH n=1 Tax=Candidatus Thalassospirochaeta sargassi TaxID=3119039 RepID=A0AAJ1ICI5_9SPIO|nr:epoxyqueuosine reductase QueH [Spirochaetales bacterium]